MLVSTRFVSAGTQQVRDQPAAAAARPGGRRGRRRRGRRRWRAPARGLHRVRAGRRAKLLAELAPRAVESEIFCALLEGAASFFTAQQRAMAAATDNADELIRTPQPHHEPGPAGLDHHRDHGDRRRRRSAPSTEGSLTLMTTTAPETAATGGAALENGRVVAIAGPVVDVEFPPHALPEINYAVEMDLDARGPHRHGDRRGRPADRRGPGPLRLHAAHRRPGPRRAGAQHRPRHQRSRSATPCSGTCSTCSVSRSTPTTSVAVDDRWEIHRPAPAFDTLEPRADDVRDRHQGHRPARAVRAGRQDRPVRRRRRGQDRPHPGDDQPGRDPPRRCVGVRRRRRAHP